MGAPVLVINKKNGTLMLWIDYKQLNKVTILNQSFNDFHGLNDLYIWSYLDRLVIVFINDILVYLKGIEEHPRHLKRVLQTLRQHQLYAKFNKCEL